MNSEKLRGLYVITDPVLCKSNLNDMVEQAILGGAEIIQYRNKNTDRQQQYNEAKALKTLCQQHDKIFIVNDNIDLAIEADADGVHLGQTDANIQDARQRLGSNKIIGITCHSDIEAAKAAQRQSADYVAFGRFYPSKTKPSAPPAKIDILQQAKAQIQIPIVAIGGISVENAPTLLKAGADMLAVINAIFAQDNIQQAARKFTELFLA